MQSLNDLQLLVKTDRRIWAAAGFLVTVTFVWFITGAWRGEDPPIPEEYIKVRVENPKIDDMVKHFNRTLKEGREERKYLQDYLARVSKQVDVGKDEIDWHVNILVNKLNDMTERVDGLAIKVGASSVHNAQLQNKLKQQKKNSRRKRAVDRSNL